jgi:hypothetical protein
MVVPRRSGGHRRIRSGAAEVAPVGRWSGAELRGVTHRRRTLGLDVLDVLTQVAKGGKHLRRLCNVEV